MLIFIPDRVRLINYVFIVPSMIYNLVVFPAWHRCRFGPEALMAKLLYGWAHLLASWDWRCQLGRVSFPCSQPARSRASSP